MPEIEVVCPSGLTGVVRGWKAREADILSNRREARLGTSFDKVLSACWLSTTEPGPYAEVINGTLPWGKVLTCDRFWALLCVRAATFGSTYEFDVSCEDRALCGKKIRWEVDLLALPFKELPEESVDKIAAGTNSFGYELQWGEHAGRKISFQLMTGDSERKAAKIIERQTARPVVASLATRIVAIEGVPSSDKVRFLDDLEMADLTALVEAFDEVDGGVETVVDIECPHCGLGQDIELPLGRDFFLPRRKKTTSRLSRIGGL